MLGLPRIPKTIVALGIIAIVVLAALYITTAETITDSSLTVILTDVNTGAQYTAIIDMQPTSTLSISGSKFYPLTTFDTETPPLDDSGIYTIGFSVTTSVSNAANLLSIDEQKVTIYSRVTSDFDGGVLERTETKFYRTTDPVTYGTHLTKTALSPATSHTFDMEPFTQKQLFYADGTKSTVGPIYGREINNTWFQLVINVKATDADGHFTQERLNADIYITVKSPTLIGITVENIGVTT